MSSSLKTADRFFIVGTACTELEQLYRELLDTLPPTWRGLHERHMQVVGDCTIREKVNAQHVLEAYDQDPPYYVDKCHPNLWIADQILKHYPTCVLLTMRPAVKDYDHVLGLMSKSPSCKKWCNAYAGLPYPNNFIGAISRAQYQALDLREKCKSRLVSHMREIDRLAAQYPDRFIVLTPYTALWKTRVHNLFAPNTAKPTPPPTQKPTPKHPTPTRKPTPKRPTPTTRKPTPKKPSSPKRDIAVVNRQQDPNRKVVLPHMPPTDKSTSLRKDIAFFWINLDRAHERRQQLEKQLNERNITHYRVSAVDGKAGEHMPHIPAGWNTAKVSQHKFELATTLSHLKAMHRFVRSGNEVGIICEDDTIFEFESRWPDSLQNIIDKAPEGWEILQLSLTLPNPREWTAIKSKNQRYVRRQPHYFSALTYAIKRTYAISVCRKFAVPVDSDNFSAKLKGNVTRLQSELNLLGTGAHRHTVYPALFTYPTGNTSFIHPTHLKAHEYSKKLSAQQYN